MAAINYDDYGDHPEGGSFAAMLNWAGAFLSILLIAGLATWGWKLWVRDVTGIPVVRALEGPMRIAPEEPGGLASAYQGLTVNRIAEERVEVAPSERVVLAPRPATLDEDEDLAMAELPVVAAPEPVLEDVVPETDIASLDPNLIPETMPLIPADPVDDAATEVLAMTPPALRAERPALSATDLAVVAAMADLGLRPEPSVNKIAAAAHVPVVTPRPLIRPVNLKRVSVSAASSVNGEIDATTIPAGTRLVQLGAYASEDVARAEWATTAGKFGDYMVGKERVVQEAQTGGRTFYRLRALGFGNLSEARRFCSVLVADGANCIPVVQE